MLPDVERVAPHGRLRLTTPLKSMTWTFPARTTDTHAHVSVNVEKAAIEWGLLGQVADELGAQAGELSVAADALPGARQAVTAALDGQRVILGAVSLTGLQDVTELEESRDPGVVEAVRRCTALSGVLALPAGPGLYTVMDFSDRRAPAP
ncbi:hypothetical protein ACWGH5_39230 [Streptomyces sp. NPDC054864]